MRRLNRLLLATLLAVPCLQAQDSWGSFLGILHQPDGNRFGLEAGIPFGGKNYNSWGMQVAYLHSSDTSTPREAGLLWASSVFMLGGFVDIGRAFLVFGAEQVDRVGKDPFWDREVLSRQRIGSYARVGIKFGWWSISAGAGSASKSTFGLTLHF